ncbi:MAG: hypothetical protein KDC98_03560 [Planctomycetes bacterium]|nr:hypothetical protein [Planctomycetota bacterium]
MRSAAFVSAFAFVAAAVFGQDDPVAAGRAAFRRASSEADKIAALDVIAKPTGAAEVAAVIAALGEGLRDDSVAVRVHAIGLVAAASDRGAALAELVAGCQALASRWERISVEDRPELGTKKLPDLFEDPEGFRKAMDEMKVNLEKLKTWTDRLAEENRVVESYLRALAGFDDDRMIDGYGSLLAVTGVDDHGRDIARALFARETRLALITAIEPLRVQEKRVGELEDRVNKIRRTKPGAPPKSWRGRREAWADQEAKRIAKRVDGARKSMSKAEGAGRSYADLLRTLAAEHGLPEPPKDEQFSSWRAWVQRAAKALSK